MTNRRPIPRQRIEAWLCLDKPEEYELLHHIIPELKTQRAYSAAIRDGLRIIWELQQGRTDHLLRSFPFLQEALQLHGPVVSTTPAQSINFSTLPSVEVRVSEHEAEHKRRSIENTLAALEDF